MQKTRGIKKQPSRKVTSVIKTPWVKGIKYWKTVHRKGTPVLKSCEIRVLSTEKDSSQGYPSTEEMVLRVDVGVLSTQKR